MLTGFNYEFFKRIFKHLGDYDDNVGAQLVEYLSEPELKMHAARPDGRRVLNILYEAMITGDVTDYQRKQANRIIEAMRISEQEYLKQAEKPMPVYPVRMQGFLTQCHGGFRASLLPNGNVRIRFTSSMIWKCDMFKRERATFAPFGGYREDHEFSPDKLVGVRLYDQNEAFAVIPAIALIDFSNQLMNKSLSVGATAFFTGLTFGAGGLGGGNVLALETAVAAEKASRVLLWGARILLWADRVAAVLPGTRRNCE